MNRRDSLKTLLTASAALITLPAWAREWKLSDVTNHNPSFLPEDQSMIAAIADTIIPSGNSIGALSVGVGKFLIKLFDNCYEKDVQENIKTQLTALNTSAKQYNKSFINCNQPERQQLLQEFSISEDKAKADFFKLIKAETIRGFTTSQEVMLKYLNYNQVPAHFYGCVDINNK